MTSIDSVYRPSPSHPLSTSEEFFHLYRQVQHATIVVAAEIHGAIDLKDMTLAYTAVLQRHPLLTAAVAQMSGQAPHFIEKAVERPAPLTISNLSGTPIHKHCDDELSKPFGWREAAIRGTLFLGQTSSTLVISADHVRLDGRAVTYLIEEILHEAATPARIQVSDFRRSQDDLLGLPPAASERPGGLTVEEGRTHQAGKSFSVERVQIDKDIWLPLRDHARIRNIKFHSLLTAAILQAGCARSPQWRDRDIVFTSVIDNRSFLPEADRIGNYISAAVDAYRFGESTGIWDVAEVIRQRLLPHLSVEAPRQFASAIRERLAHGLTPEKSVEIFSGLELMVTNYGSLAIDQTYANLSLVGVMPHVLSPAHQTVSVATVGGKLSMSNVGFSLIPGLLEETKFILAELAEQLRRNTN